MNIYDVIIQKTRNEQQYNDMKDLLTNKKPMDVNVKDLAKKSTEALNSSNFKDHQRYKRLSRMYPKYVTKFNKDEGDPLKVLEEGRLYRLRDQGDIMEGLNIRFPTLREQKKIYKQNQRYWKEKVLPLVRSNPEDLTDEETITAVMGATMMESLPGFFSKKGKIEEEDREPHIMSSEMQKKLRNMVQLPDPNESSGQPRWINRTGHQQDPPYIDYDRLNPEKIQLMSVFDDVSNFYGGSRQHFTNHMYNVPGFLDSSASSDRKPLVKQNPERQKIDNPFKFGEKWGSKKFTKAVEEAFEKLPDKLKEKFNNVVIGTKNPDDDTERSAYAISYKMGPKKGKWANLIPNLIYLFEKSFAPDIKGDFEFNIEQIMNTIIHELGHHSASTGY